VREPNAASVAKMYRSGPHQRHIQSIVGEGSCKQAQCAVLASLLGLSCNGLATANTGLGRCEDHRPLDSHLRTLLLYSRRAKQKKGSCGATQLTPLLSTNALLVWLQLRNSCAQQYSRMLLAHCVHRCQLCEVINQERCTYQET
jgi:uncharacterized low-complexity protein